MASDETGILAGQKRHRLGHLFRRDEPPHGICRPELAPHQITANLVSPATVADPTANSLLTAEEVGQLGATNPMGRLVTPEEVAKAVAFLAGEDSGFITGHCLEVNGGLAMD
ncbi:hypothetical protein A5622_10290 [Mycobacterium sp. 1245801.1]|nr:hypothetical protein A5622_10290 [Mycobacterium sp. 1245801.1]